MPDVTLKGNAVTLAGSELNAGDSAPDFTLQSNGLEEVTCHSVRSDGVELKVSTKLPVSATIVLLTLVRLTEF